MTDYAGDDVEDEYWKEVNKENEFDSKITYKLYIQIHNVLLINMLYFLPREKT